MYGKVFASMYEGSLYGHWEAIVTLQQLIVLCDSHGVVDMTPPAIAARTSIPLAIIEKGLELLQQPDKYSRSVTEDGRRIVALDSSRPWGWRLVNYPKYRAIRTAEERREYHRQYWHKRKASTDSTETQQTQPIAEAEGEEEAEENIRAREAFEELKAAYPRTANRTDWILAERNCLRQIDNGSTWSELTAAAKRYAAQCAATGRVGTQYVTAAHKLYADEAWRDDFALPVSKEDAEKIARQEREASQWEALKVRAKESGFRDPWKVESLGVYETALREHERESRVVQMRRG